MTVVSFGEWNNNAELIASCFDLGYLDEERFTLDPTYGKGRFWKIKSPRALVASDIVEAKSPLGRSVDFTALPWEDESFEDVVFDGPYKLNGTPDQGGPADSDEDYGVDEAVRWQDRMALLRSGITECIRVLERGGHLLVKCQDQVCSGKVRWQTIDFTRHAEKQGLELFDMLHLAGIRPQPSNRRQVHSHRNYSTMLVFKKPKRKKKVS